jgi:hypothetical protein
MRENDKGKMKKGLRVFSNIRRGIEALLSKSSNLYW